MRYCDWKTNEEKDEITCSTPSLPEDYVNPKTTLEWLTYTKARKLIAPNDMEFICYTMKAGYGNLTAVIVLIQIFISPLFVGGF